MTSLLWQGTSGIDPASTSGTASGSLVTDLAGLAPGPELAPAARQELADLVQARQQGELASSLTAALQRLDTSLRAVSWPDEASTPTTSGTPSSIPSPDTGPGLDLDARTTLAPGTYTLASAPKGADQPVIHVNSGDTWAEVLASMSRAFGASGAALVSGLVPVTRTLAVSELSTSLSGVLAAHNAVADLLEKNADSLKPGAAQAWTGLAAARSSSLAGVGVERSGSSLWLEPQAFGTALSQNPGAVRAALAEPGGLLPALAQATAKGLSGESWLAGAGQAQAGTAALDAAGVEKSGALLDVYEGNMDIFSGPAGGGGLVRQRG